MQIEWISYAVGALLVVAAVMDTKMSRIPNWLVLVLAALFVAKVVLFPQSVDLIWQIVFAVCVFVGGFALFAAGAFGAGAVKLAGVTALFMPLDWIGTLGLILLAGIFATGFLSGLARSMWGGEDSSWTVLAKRIIPLAIPIAVTGLAGLFLF